LITCIHGDVIGSFLSNSVEHRLRIGLTPAKIVIWAASIRAIACDHFQEKGSSAFSNRPALVFSKIHLSASPIIMMLSIEVFVIAMSGGEPCISTWPCLLVTLK
jgi:hypothetical protein